MNRQPKPNKTDAGNGSKATCHVSNVLRSPSPDPRRSPNSMTAPQNDLPLLHDAVHRAISEFRCSGRVPNVLFLHSHPQYGQVHIYIEENLDFLDAGALIGKPIAAIANFDEWEMSWERAASAEVEARHDAWAQQFQLTLPDGSTLAPTGPSQVDEFIGRSIDLMIRNSISSLPHLPLRVIVMSEHGDYYSDWMTVTSTEKT